MVTRAVQGPEGLARPGLAAITETTAEVATGNAASQRKC